MLNIVMGDVGSGKSTYISQRICEDIERGEGAYLIVPDQQTVERERAMAGILPPSAPLGFEVTNFSRLANTVFRSLGGLCYNYADKTVRMLIMWRTLSELSPMLHEFGDPDERKISRALAAVNELHFSKITPSMLSNAKELVTGKTLKNRLSDLSLICTLYGDLVHGEYSDTADDLDRLCDLLDKTPFFAGKKIYIDGFVSFTEQQYGVLARLIKTADVTVSICHDFTGEKLCYSESGEVAARLKKMAGEANISVKTAELRENKRTKSPLIKYVADNIWSQSFYSARYMGAADPSLTVAEAGDIYSEAEYVAALTASLVRGGARYSDIAVVAEKAESYLGILDGAFERYGVPYFMSKREDVNSLELIRFIQSAYAVISRGFRLEDVVTYFKCGLCPVTEEEADRFELYLHKWDINGREMYLSDTAWNMNPRGYEPEYTELDNQILYEINDIRARAFAPLSRLYEDSVGVHTVEEHSRSLVTFLTSQRIEEMLVARSLQMSERGDGLMAEYYARLWGVACDCLDTLVKTVGDASVRAEEYAALLRMVFSSVDMGRIPSSRDEVTVGDADTLRIDTKKHIIMIGVNEGVFPASVKDGGLFGESDRRELLSVGVRIGDGREAETERKLFTFMRTMLLASDTLTVCYHKLNAQLASARPSYALLRIRGIANGREKFVDVSRLEPEFFSCTAQSARHALSLFGGTPVADELRNALAELDGFERECAPHTPITDRDCRVADTASALGDSIRLSQSKIDRFVKCPFSYYCKYVLRLSGNEKSEFGVSNVGSFIHACLEKMLSAADKNEKDIAVFTDTEIDEAVRDAAREYTQRVCPPEKRSSARLSHLFSRLERTARLVARNMRDEFAQTAFRPKMFEAEISGRGDIAPLRFPLSDNSSISVGGKVDRIDTFEKDGKTYIRVVDYKTGTRKFSLDNIRKGEEIQMLLYLFSVAKNGGHLFDGEPVAAGVSYMIADTSPTKTDRPPATENEAADKAMASFVRSGVMIDEKCVVDALSAGENKAYLTDLITKERLGEAFSELEQTLVEIGNRIRSGEASVPTSRYLEKEKSCTFCEMRDVCRSRVNSKLGQ